MSWFFKKRAKLLFSCSVVVASYGNLKVIDQNGYRYLLDEGFDGNHSVYDPSDPENIPTSYIRKSTLGLAYLDGLKGDSKCRFLMIGLGGGSFSNLLHRKFPQAKIDVVENNKDVIEIAKKYFDVKPNIRYQIHHVDASDFIKSNVNKAKYDLIMVDGYTTDDEFYPHIPRELTTIDFFENIKTALKSDGVAVFNIVNNLNVTGGKASKNNIRKVFTNVDYIRAGWSNHVLFANNKDNGTDKNKLYDNARKLDDTVNFSFYIADYARDVESFSANPT